MAIDRISFPASTPTAVADYQAQNTLISAAFSESANVVPFVGSAMTTGYVFQVGGTVYQVNGTVNITGTASAYVKITPSGATATASFVANLTGVTWSNLYNGYYDGSGNRYIFDESSAIASGVITYANRKTSQWGVGISQSGGFVGGYGSRADDGGAVGSGAIADSGGAIGSGAIAATGGAAGYNANATAGGAVGGYANASAGGAVGYNANATNGGAVGYNTNATLGGAVGYNATATNGFSGGSHASSEDDQFSMFNKVKYGYFVSTITENAVFLFLNSITTITGVNYPVIGSFNSQLIGALQKISATQIRITYGTSSTKLFTSGASTQIGFALSIMTMVM